MWRHPRKRPLDLADVPTVLGSYIGLVIGVSGAVAALSTLLDAALRGALAAATVGKPWWVSALQSLVWAVGGGAGLVVALEARRRPAAARRSRRASASSPSGSSAPAC